MAQQKQATKTTKPTSRTAALRARGTKHVDGFFDFIRTQGVVGLAVGLVIGGAVSVLVKSLIDNLVMPPLGFILGSADGLKGLSVNLGRTIEGKDAVLHYGTFLNDLINFLVIALTIYLVVHLFGFDKLDKKKE
ncbi:MAG TPA: MscL family protein [Candidatus Saccharimonadales bacterium]|nr:MscL family protein [Candidatus Saccharimonadales bacterium]